MSSCNCQHGDSHNTAAKVGTLERPRYSPGLILEDADLTAAVDYTRNLNRMLFRSLFGCGVVCGLQVSVKDDCGLKVTVQPGLGLDGCGDPLHLAGPLSLTLDRHLTEPIGTEPPRNPDFWVIACNRENPCLPRAVVCDGDDLDGLSQNTRIRSGIEISISFTEPKCACGCRSDGDLTARATALRDQDPPAAEAYREACHKDHYDIPDCAADCGCGTACACGCCIVLAWAHWYPEGNDARGIEKGWHAIHRGVRRFVRPALIADPVRDLVPVQQP